MGKFFMRVLPLTLIVLLLAGCWDSRDLEDKSILESLLVDQNENGYVFYTNVAGISAQKSGGNGGSGQGGQAQFKTVRAEGKDFTEARDNVDKQLEQPVFLGALQALILTEKMAKNGIEEYILRLRQTPDYRKTVDVVITAEDPEKLIEFKPNNQVAAGFAIKNVIQNLVESGETFHIPLARILAIMASPNDCYVLHTIGIESNLEVTGFSVFDEGKWVGFIPKEKCNGLVILKSDATRFQYHIPYKDGSVAVRLLSAKKNVKPQYKDGKVSFDIAIDVDAQVLYPHKDLKISEGEKQEITTKLQKAILDEIADTIRTSQQEFKCDYLNFYNVFRIGYPEEAKNADWKKLYAKAEFSIKVTAKLDLTSTIHYHEH